MASYAYYMSVHDAAFERERQYPCPWLRDCDGPERAALASRCFDGFRDGEYLEKLRQSEPPRCFNTRNQTWTT